ncbi:hypothetical protein V6N13_020040 [Hibiscus sabdariffa]
MTKGKNEGVGPKPKKLACQSTSDRRRTKSTTEHEPSSAKQSGKHQQGEPNKTRQQIRVEEWGNVKKEPDSILTHILTITHPKGPR